MPIESKQENSDQALKSIDRSARYSSMEILYLEFRQTSTPSLISDFKFQISD